MPWQSREQDGVGQEGPRCTGVRARAIAGTLENREHLRSSEAVNNLGYLYQESGDHEKSVPQSGGPG